MTRPRPPRRLASLLLCAGALAAAGCGMAPRHSAPASGMSPDMSAMCKHDPAATPEQRRAAMTERMRAMHPSMDAAELARHREMAERRCAAMRPGS